MIQNKKIVTMLTLTMMLLQMATIRIGTVFAQTATVVINEIAWAGTADNSNDEWIELYNSTNTAIDLSGWTIEDDETTVYTITSGQVPAHGFFVIEDREEAISDRQADALIGLSLANTGDALVLKNQNGQTMDSVNLSGAWFAGDNTTKATMERIDPAVDGNTAANWASAISNNGKHGANGTLINGTPGSANSVYEGGLQVRMTASGNTTPGSILEIDISIAENAALYAYGMDINYDPSKLKYLSSLEGGALNGDGQTTAFIAALENGQEGKLVIGNARLLNPPAALDYSKDLFTITFEVLQEFENAQISFAGGAYLSDTNGDIEANFKSLEISGDGQPTDPTGAVTNLQANLGEGRYSIALNWNHDSAEKYLILRKNQNGTYAPLAETTEKSYVDANNILPNVTYYYQVIAVKNGTNGSAAEISMLDNRGLSGDNDRSDRIDGRDIENLARAYGTSYGNEGYFALIDMNYDGVIDGSDLIDIGVNFGLTY